MKNTKEIAVRGKYLVLMAVLVLPFIISGCTGVQEVDMNSLGANGKYNYKNPDLGFKIELPKEFIYYQTQRNSTSDYNELEIYVPTSDTTYAQEVSGYGKPVAVRVYKKDVWDKVSGREAVFKKIGEKNNQIYVIEFWSKVPKDWKDKWTETMKSGIISSFNIL